MSEETVTENLPVPIAATVPVVNGVFAPNDLEGVWRLATILASSGMVPAAYRNKTEDTFVAISWGMEIGLSHNQSLQAIAVIDGKPSIYGDVGLALVRGSGKLEDIHEFFEGEFGHDDYKAVCEIKRKGEKRVHRSEFSIEDAKLMKKWNTPTKSGRASVWMKHPKRMLRWRARWYLLRDVFGDVLKGLSIYEEIRDSIDMEPDDSGTYTISANVETDASAEKAKEEPAEKAKEAPAEWPADEPVVDEAPKTQPQVEPGPDDYVNPGEDEPVAPPALMNVPIEERFLKAMGDDLAEASKAFVEKACEINGCPAEEIYKDALSRPDEFIDIITKWSVKMRKQAPLVADGGAPEETPEETPEVDNNTYENTAPVDIIISKAAMNYNGALGSDTEKLLRAYVEYIEGLAGMTPDQILMGLNKTPEDWFKYFEDWCQTEGDKAAEAAQVTGVEGASVKAPDSVETGTTEPELDNTNLIKPGKESWPTWKLKWNTMKPEDFKGFVWSNLDRFVAAGKEAVAIDKRARAKWAKQWGDAVYPVDAKAQDAAAQQEKVEAGDEDANSTIETRWNFILKNYPKATEKAMKDRRFATGGLTNGAKQMIIQDVYEACGN